MVVQRIFIRRQAQSFYLVPFPKDQEYVRMLLHPLPSVNKKLNSLILWVREWNSGSLGCIRANSFKSQIYFKTEKQDHDNFLFLI